MEALTTLLVNGGIVAALLEASKRALGTHFDWSRYGAWLAMLTGIATAEAAVYLNWYGVASVDYKQAVFAGLMAGITASGLNRGVTQSAPTVVVEGTVQSGPAAGMPATSVIAEPAVTADSAAPALGGSLTPAPQPRPAETRMAPPALRPPPTA